MLLYQELSDKILRAYFNELDVLGKGLAEKVYENALSIEFEELGIRYERQFPLQVEYKGHVVGSYVADFFVEGKIIVELKAVIAQTINYINLTHSKVGYILNFGQLEGKGYKRLIGLAAKQDF